jgi:hypothetical protein
LFTIIGSGKLECEHDVIITIFHVPQLSENMFFVPQLAQTREEVDFWPNKFAVKI